MPDTTTPEGASRFLALARPLLERLPPRGTYRILLDRCLASAVGLNDRESVGPEASLGGG